MHIKSILRRAREQATYICMCSHSWSCNFQDYVWIGNCKLDSWNINEAQLWMQSWRTHMYNWTFSTKSWSSCKHFQNKNLRRTSWIEDDISLLAYFVDLFILWKLMTCFRMHYIIWSYVMGVNNICWWIWKLVIWFTKDDAFSSLIIMHTCSSWWYTYQIWNKIMQFAFLMNSLSLMLWKSTFRSFQVLLCFIFAWIEKNIPNNSSLEVNKKLNIESL